MAEGLIFFGLALAFFFIVYYMGFLLLVAFICALLFSYATKPTNASFKKYLQNDFTKKLNMGKSRRGFGTKLTANIITKIVDKDIKDYVFIKVATMDFMDSGNPIYFLGAFQNWYEIREEA